MDEPIAIDEGTLELLMNKKMMKKMFPTRFKERKQFLEKVRDKRVLIRNIIDQLLENPEDVVSTEVNENFEGFLKSCLKHLDTQNEPSFEKEDEEEDEGLFEVIDEPAVRTGSLWGDKIHKKYSYLHKF
jgi:hemerythrin-like domain-containing protein